MSGTRDYVLVLVVEDNPQRVELFQKWLQHPNLRLLHVRSGDGALNCLTDRFDCILLDHDLLENHPLGGTANVDSRGVVDQLVQSGVNWRTPIIVHSMNPGGRNEIYQRLRANGFSVEIKPFAEWTGRWAEDLKEELHEEWGVARG